MTPDVNVLIAAFLEHHPQRTEARRWLAEALSADPRLTLLPMVAVGFLRVVTGNRIDSAEEPTARAVAFLKSLLRSPGVSWCQLGAEWSFLEASCLERNLRGPIISDAWIAAAVQANGLHLVTFDADFTGLLPPHQYTLLKARANLQEVGARYVAWPQDPQPAMAA